MKFNKPRLAPYATKSMITKKGTWICVAANGPNIKKDNSRPWRFCFGRPGEKMGDEIQIADCLVDGKAEGEKNFLWRSSKNGGTNMHGVVGWIEFFGDAEVGSDDVLHVILTGPETGKT